MQRVFHATDNDNGRRLDQFLVEQVPEVSRVRIQQLIAQAKVEVDGKPAKAALRLRGGEEIMLLGAAERPPLKAVPENIPLTIVHEDSDIAVIDKPAGMMVHAGAGSTEDDEEPDPRTRGTLVNALLHRFRNLSQTGGELRPGIVHRLDKDTSGLIVVAKTDAAHRRLAEQFSGREVAKTYIALVQGWPKAPRGTINAAVGRDPSRRHRMSTRARDGRNAISHYQVTSAYDTPYGRFALLEVKIETGRTHQIRVHLASIGHPVVGDTLYGAAGEISPVSKAYSRAQRQDTKSRRDRAASERARALTEARMSGKKAVSVAKARGGGVATSLPPLHLERNFLHAAKLEFRHPTTGKPVRFSSELPKELCDFLGALTHPKK